LEVKKSWLNILSLIRTLKLSLPRFLELLFAIDGPGDGAGNAVSFATSSFLNTHEKTIYIDHILDLIYLAHQNDDIPLVHDITPQSVNVEDCARYRYAALGYRQALSWAILHAWMGSHCNPFSTVSCKGCQWKCPGTRNIELYCDLQ